MERKILLVEPNYANKYPPIGLMKIATYHRQLGDNVRFFKGDLKDLVVDYLFQNNLKKLVSIDKTDWLNQQELVKKYIKTKRAPLLENIILKKESNFPAIKEILNSLAGIIRKKNYEKYPKYDRVYVTTLFTFHWNITVSTVEFCKNLVTNLSELHVGGVLATLLASELESETGIKPKTGLLDKPGELDNELPSAKEIIVDNLPLDYSILDEIDYEYPTKSAYFTFMTKGCTRKCTFCSVPYLEPEYKPKIETIDKFAEINKQFGEQQNLLLMDNNVLASPNFFEIIDEIKSMGFVKDATYTEPNQLEIAIRNLESGYNDFAFVRRTFRLIHSLTTRLKKPVALEYLKVLAEHRLLFLETATKENLLQVYPLISNIYEKYRAKSSRLRYVDFNQGTDCRYVTEERMQKMSEIPIRPLRIAFDHLSLKEKYIEAVKLAAKYKINKLSNYILYNFNDKPEELWKRLKINADLCLEFNIEIFSFPMKYIPLFGEEAKHRKYTGKYWNKKFIRSVQSILNVTKGIVAPSHRNEKTSFFEEAFGKTLEEFNQILYMPEQYIVYRNLFRQEGYVGIWESEYRSLSESDRQIAQKIIEECDFSDEAIRKFPPSDNVRHFLRHYTVTRKIADIRDERHLELKTEFDRLIKEDQAIDLTLTYDFDLPTDSRGYEYSSSIASKMLL
jgi:hypothetical protein